MPTLSKAKKETKLIFKWGGISLIAFFIFLVLMRFTSLIKDYFTPPPTPTVSFGKLDPIIFPSQQKENITYSLNTLSGFLPKFPILVKVYKINTEPPTLLGLNKTQAKIARVGFDSNGIPISEDTYQWIDQKSSFRRQITINIFSSDFTLSSLYLTAPSLQTFNNANEQISAAEQARYFLDDMSLFAADIDPEKTKSVIYSIENGVLTPITKISDAKIVRVDFFQKDLDNLPIYYQRGTSSTIDVLVGKENNTLKIVEARYFHKNISDIFATYAIKSALQAFEELKQGKGYIASKPQNAAEITINQVLLGYYIGEDQQGFLMPIIIFEGDNDFIAYVSAVRDEWINN